MKNEQQNDLIFVIPEEKRLANVFRPYAACAGFAFTDADPEEKKIPEGTMIDKAGGLPPLATRVYRTLDALRRLSLGTVDIIVAGRDKLEEFNARAEREGYSRIVSRPVELPLSECALQFIVPANDRTAGPGDLAGRVIATSYPGLVGEWLAERGIRPKAIREFSGKVENHVRDGAAEIGCDIVETGETLRKNGLRATGIVVMESSAVILRAGRDRGAGNEAVIARVIGRLAETARTPAP